MSLGGLGLPNLQGVYDAWDGTIPAILLDSTRGGVSIEDAATPLGTELFGVCNFGATHRHFCVKATRVEIGTHNAVVSTGPHPLVYVQDTTNTFQLWPTDRTFISNPGSFFGCIGVNLTYNYANISVGGLNLQYTMTMQNNPFLFNHILLFNNGIFVTNTPASACTRFGPGQTFISQPTWQADTDTITLGLTRDILSQPKFQTTNGGTLNVTNWGQVQCYGTLSTGANITTRTGLDFIELLGSGGTITTARCIHIANLTRATNNYGIQSELAAGANKYFIYHTGSATSRFAGSIEIDADVLGLILGASQDVTLGWGAANFMFWQFNASANQLRWSNPSSLRFLCTGAASSTTELNFDCAKFSLGAQTGSVGNQVGVFVTGARSTSIAGEWSDFLLTQAGNITLNAAMTLVAGWTVNAPAITLGTGTVTTAGVLNVGGNVNQGSVNRFGVRIISNPSGGSGVNAALWVTAGLSRFDGRVDINNGIALGGGATATLGTIGGSGPTAAAQAQWVEIDINGTPHWIAVWT